MSTFQHANAKRRTQLATTFVDIDRARLLDVVPGRSGQVIRDWIGQQPVDWVDGIEVAAIGAFRGYATAIGEVLPDATLVIDHFHAIRLASTAVSDARRRVQQDTLGHRGRTSDPLYGSADSCCAPGRTSTTAAGNACAKASPPATPMVTSLPSGSLASCCPEVYTAHDLHREAPVDRVLPARR